MLDYRMIADLVESYRRLMALSVAFAQVEDADIGVLKYLLKLEESLFISLADTVFRDTLPPSPKLDARSPELQAAHRLHRKLLEAKGKT